MRIFSASITFAAFGCVLSAQSLISPVGHAGTEGNSNNTYPFNATFHYMQVHADLRGKVLPIKGMSFRRDGTLSSPYAGRTLDIEVWMGDSDFSAISGTYANNFTGTKANVFKRAKISTPAWPKPPSAPASFDFSVPFNNGVFLYVGATDFAWEWVTHSTTSTQTYPADAVTQTGTVNGPYSVNGTGCVATGQTRNFRATAYLSTYRSPDRVRYYAYNNYGRASSPGAILVGATNPNTPFPVCGPARLYTDAGITIPGLTNASGYFNSGTNIYVPWNAAYTGVKLYTQSYCLDAAQGPLPVAVTNGVESTVPALGPLPGSFARIFSRGNPNATTGNVGKHYAVVTRFDG